MKPFLFLDVDGVLNCMPDKKEDLHPKFMRALCRVPGTSEFLRWAIQHFEIRWCTAWCLGNSMRPDNFEHLSWLTGLTVEEIAGIGACPWDGETKTSGIERILAENPDREWVWLDDDKMKKEQKWLLDTDNVHRFVNVNCFKDKHALQKAHRVLEHWLEGRQTNLTNRPHLHDGHHEAAQPV